MNALGVAAALKIEDTVGAPAVLVVANQAARGIGGERRLAGARESEEERGHAVAAHIGRAVHGKNVALRQQKIHDAEDRFLHLAGVLCAADQHDLAGEVNDDEDFRVGAVALGIGQKAGRAHDGELRLVCLQLLRCGTYEKLPDKKIMPGIFVDELDGQLVTGIGAAEQVLHEELFVGRDSRARDRTRRRTSRARRAD